MPISCPELVVASSNIITTGYSLGFLPVLVQTIVEILFEKASLNSAFRSEGSLAMQKEV